MNVTLQKPTRQQHAPRPGREAVAVLMSGGVDSSVAAYLLRAGGYDVVGITMLLPATEIAARRRVVAVVEALDIPHYFVDAVAAFSACVIGRFHEEYLGGRTPNPCIDCNAELKFGRVWECVEETLSITRMATGHYALAVRQNERVYLRRAPDRQKDQSYFLYGIPPRRLPFFHLPLEGRSKREIRALARRHHLPVAEQSESMDLCFAGGDYRAILPARADAPGPILDPRGKRIGTHQGIHHYTVGQRRGLGVALGHPAFVLQIRPEENAIVVGTRAEASHWELVSGPMNILLPGALCPGARLRGKIRSVGEPLPCTVTSAAPDRCVVEFDEPVFAPTPGQHLVLYDSHDSVVAGGVIREVLV